MPQNTFKKNERLTRHSDIQELFKNGSSFYLYPFKIIYSPNEDGPRVLFSVPKKLFKKAVVRNKIKRQMREAYRQNKIHDDQGEVFKFNIAYIYLAKEPLDYKTIENKLNECNHRLKRQGKEPSRNGKKS